MKVNFLTLITLFFLNLSFAQITKYDDWDIAKQQSELKGKNILIILTGAEWCKPCVKMEKNVIENEQFIEYANQNLVILEINIPRNQNYNSKTWLTALNQGNNQKELTQSLIALHNRYNKLKKA